MVVRDDPLRAPIWWAILVMDALGQERMQRIMRAQLRYNAYISSLVVTPYIRGVPPFNLDPFGCLENHDFLYKSTLGPSKSNSP